MAIQSESKFIWKFILHVLATPFIFFLVLFGKRNSSDLWRPLSDLWQYIKEPTCTITLVTLNIVCFIGSFFLTEREFSALLLHPSDIVQPERYYSFITSGFLHGDAFHLIGNVIALFVVGRIVESKLGSAKLAIIYFTALIVSSIASTAINYFIIGETIPSLGASGAIAGVVSAATLLDPFYFVYELIIPLPVMIVGWIYIVFDFLDFFSGVVDGVSHIAHITGYLSVIAVVFLLSEDRKAFKRGALINVCCLALAAGVFFFI